MRLIILITLIGSLSFGGVEKCLDAFEKQKVNIVKKLESQGFVYFGSCVDVNPYTHVVFIDMNSSENKISVTVPDKNNDTYPLRTINKIARKEGAAIAINGFGWEGNLG